MAEEENLVDRSWCEINHQVALVVEAEPSQTLHHDLVNECCFL